MSEKSKNICFFNTNRAWGGGEKWHLTTAKEMNRRGYHSILVTNNGSELYQHQLHQSDEDHYDDCFF